MKISLLPLFLLCLGVGVLRTAAAETPAWSVKVNGKEVALHEFLQGAFGQFELAAENEVEIKTTFNVRWVDVRPRSAGIQPQIGPDFETVRFKLSRPGAVVVEFNSDIARVLHLFPYQPETDAPKSGTPHVRYFGPGKHDAGLMDLKSGETVYLAPGAWVYGTVRSIGTKNVAIRGRGVLDGSKIDHSAPLPAPPAAAGDSAKKQVMPDYAAGVGNMIYLQNVEGARLEGITIFDSKAWTVYARSSRQFHVSGVNILNPSTKYGNDGFDIVSTSDVLIEDVFVRTNDDCVVVKNLDDIDTRNIRVRRGVFWNMPVGGNGLEIGFEVRNRGVSDITFEDCDIIHVERGAAISIHNGDAGPIENVVFDNIRVEDVRRKVIDFCVLYAQYGLDKFPTVEERRRRMDRGGVWDGHQRLTPAERKSFAAGRGHVRNVTVRNLHVVEGPLPYSIVSGYDEEHRVDDVTIEGFKYQGRELKTPEEAKLVTAFAHNVTIR